MLAPIRRSLSERAVGAAIQCTACSRQIHNQAAIRSAAAAAAQVQQFKHFPTTANSSKKSSIPKSPSRSSSKTRQIENNTHRHSEPKSSKSSKPCFESDVLRAYPHPTEEQVPSSIEIPMKGKKVQVTWRKSPMQYLRDGLKVLLTIESHQFNLNKKTYVRVRLTASWGKDKHTAIGEGENRVHSLYRGKAQCRNLP